MKYDWCEYYRQAYEREKIKNTVLAGKVADAEAKREELQAKYKAICGNALYRASRIVFLPGRACRKVVHEVRELLCRCEKATPVELAISYQERLACQGDAYGQWIRKEEPLLWRQCTMDLEKEKDPEYCKRSCAVFPYQSLAGITELSRITGGAALNLPAGESEPDIFLFVENPENLDERAVSYIEKYFSVYRETKLFYGAEDHSVGGERSFPWFKSCFSPDTLLGFFYFGSYFALDRTWAGQISLSGCEDAKQNLYEFVLRLLKPYFELQKSAVHSSEIVCTDLILYHQSDAVPFEIPTDRECFLHTEEMHELANPEFWGYEEKYVEIKRNFINNICHESFSYQTLHPEVWSVVPEISRKNGGSVPLVSVVIPSKDHPELLKKCVGSFVERTSLPNLQENVEFIIVDNGSNEGNRQTIQNFLESVKAECHYLYRPMSFNFSAMCNIGVEEAHGEYILLLNDDMEIIEENWLRILLGQVLLPGTGAVGAKLWYPEDERIQHAGITNMQVGPSHKLVTFPDDRTYYYGHNTVTYDMIAVTAACLLVRKSLYQEVDGLDEEMAVAYNDVDFCFKLAEAGYRNVIRNDAVLLHYESASRGMDEESAEKWRRLLEEKAKLYKKHPLFLGYDPYYSEQLAGYAIDYRIGYQYPYEKSLLTVVPEKRAGKRKLGKIISGTVMLTVERIGSRNKLCLEDPDILEAEGWCYMLGRDNSLFERWFILEAEQGDYYYQIPVKERRRPDVEAILPLQKNIELSGFTCRVLKEDIISGKYTAGMLYRDLCSGKTAYKRSDRHIEV